MQAEKSIFGLLISNPRNRKLEIFRYYAQNRREILNLSIHVFSKSAKWLLLNNSLKKGRKKEILLAPECIRGSLILIIIKQIKCFCECV